MLGDWGLGIGDCPIPNPQSPNNRIRNNNFLNVCAYQLE